MNLQDKSSGEKGWILSTRILGFIIMFLPFIPNALFYLGLRSDEISISGSAYVFIVFGFLLVWGSGNFGAWANSVGKTIVNKVKK